MPPIVLSTALTLIDWVMTILIFMMIWYVIKFFLIPFKDKSEVEAEESARREKFKSWIGDVKETHKKKSELDKRQKHFAHIRSFLVQAMEHGEDVVAKLFSVNERTRIKGIHGSKSAQKNLVNDLYHVKYSLRTLKRNHEGEEARFFGNLYDYIDLAYRKSKRISFPDVDLDDWSKKINAIEDIINGDQGIIPLCGIVLKAIDDYVEKAKLDQLQALAREKIEAEQVANDETQSQQDTTQGQAQSSTGDSTPEQSDRRQRLWRHGGRPRAVIRRQN